MPVRKIKKNYRSVTGLISSRKNSRMVASESTLERDLFTCLEFDPVVKGYEEQPILIEYKNESGKNTTYTPDVFIEFNPIAVDFRSSIFYPFNADVSNLELISSIKGIDSQYRHPAKRYNPFQPIVAEVKYRAELFENWKKFKPKFKVAREFAKTKGWKFCIFTENEIRGTLLTNIKFLSKYARTYHYIESEIETILMKMKIIKKTTPKLLLDSICNDKMEQAKLIPVLWHLIANNVIKTDLHQVLTMNSEISL